MWELERNAASELPACALVGRGRLGTALAAALPAARLLGRGEPVPAGIEIVLLCVPDSEIANAAAAVAPGPFVGHCSGATTLAPLAEAGHAKAFSIHPLMTVPATGADFTGATAAVAGAPIARRIAQALGMRAIEVDDADRAAYHAAASVASNFLITLEGAAEAIAQTANVDRAALVPLVRAAVDNWARSGAKRALTGPVARGDHVTVRKQREAVAQRVPEHLPLFDALTQATERLANAA